MNDEEVVKSRLVGRLGKLSLVDEGKVPQFFHAVIDNMLGREKSIDNFGPNLELVQDAYTELFTRAVGGSSDGVSAKDEVITTMGKAGIGENLSAQAASCCAAREDQILEQLKKDGGFPMKFKDFDWSIRLTVSSDKLAAMRVPVAILELNLKGNDGSTKQVHLELTQESLDRLISDCDEISRVVQKLAIN